MAQENIIKAAWFTPGIKGRWGLPLILVGPPGGGKTTRIEQLAADYGLWGETVISSLREPSDFLGLPVPDLATGRVRFLASAWVRRLVEHKHGVAILDEINTCAPATQAALLRAILEGVVGEEVTPPTVRWTALMNAVEDAAGGYDLAMPLANRFGHLAAETPSAAQWTDYMLAQVASIADSKRDVVDPIAEEKRVMALWPSAFAKAAGMVTAFISARPDLLLKKPVAGDPAASGAFSTPRTLEMATRSLAGSEVHDLSEIERDELFTAFVGQGCAKEFRVWSRNMDLPAPGDVLDGKVKFAHDPARLDRTMAVLSACAAYITPATVDKRQPRWTAMCKLLDVVSQDAMDVVVPAVRALLKARPILRSPEWTSVTAKLNPILSAAGYTA